MTEPLLAAAGLTKTFGATVAVDDLSLTVGPGECRGIIGPNGSGKTTLFDLLTGYLKPDAGEVRYDGEVVTGTPPDRLARRGLVRTFQLVAPFEGLTVRQNLLSVYPPEGRPGLRVPGETVDRADIVLELLELEDVSASLAGELSGGQQQLLELGRVLMLDPACVLLDEPTAGVNPGIQDRLLRHLRRLNERGTALVVIEHDMGVIGELAERVSVVDRGRLVAEGPFEDVVRDPWVREAYLGREPGAESGERGSGGVAPERRRQRAGVHRDGLESEAGVARTDAGRLGPDGTISPYLEARGVVAGYRNRTVLDGVSIRSHEGVTCVFGPNGSGKSTLLKVLAGVLPATAGTVAYGDRDITGLGPHEVVDLGITTIPQGGQLFDSLSVRENLLLGATPVADRATVRDRLEAVRETFPPLDETFAAEARDLSGGQRALLAFARAMMSGADVYLLDEPVSGLAPSAIDEVFGVVQSLVDRGAQVVLVEQQVREALEVADHVYLLAQGAIRFDGKPSDLEDEDELMSLYLGLD